MSPDSTAVHGMAQIQRDMDYDEAGTEKECRKSGGQHCIGQSEDLSSGTSPAVNSLCDLGWPWSSLSIGSPTGKMRDAG